MIAPHILRRLRPRILAMQLAGNALLGLLSIAWLQIPDSHAWEFVCSMLSAAILLAGVLWLHADTMRCLRQPAQPIALWKGMAILAGWILLWDALVRCLSPLQDGIYLRAGYWNSQLSAHQRNFFTYNRLVDWQQDIFTVLIWWALPVLLLPLIVESVACGLWSMATWKSLRISIRWQLWVGVGIAAWAALTFTDKITDWQPSHTVHGEILSLILRFSILYLAGILIYCAVLAIVAEFLAREHAGRDTVS